VARGTRRQVVLGGLSGALLAAGAAGAACGPQTGGAPPALRAGTRLTWMYGTAASNPGVRESLESVARDFERAHPGLSVEPLHVTEAYYDKLQNLLVAGTPPEVFWLDVRSFPAYALRGDLAALDPLLKRDRYELGDFYDRLVKQYVWRDTVRALPWDMGCGSSTTGGGAASRPCPPAGAP
jgi:multiple sugar transport system substrate-binding protein